MTARKNGLRPAVGSVSICLLSIDEATDALDVSMIGVSPVTVTASVMLPISSSMSSTTNCCVPMRTALWSTVLNPVSAAFTV